MTSQTDISLSEYIAQSMRGQNLHAFNSGSALGPNFLSKDTYLTVANSTFAQTYGRKVWDALNNRTVFYNALKKVPWGPTAGWIERSDRGSGRMRPVTETGTLPTINVSTYQKVYTLPKIVAADFGVPIQSVIVNTLEGGMGDVMGAELQACERDFVKGINQMLTAGSVALISSGGQTTFVCPSATVANYFKIGDTVGFCDASTGAEGDAGETITVSSISSATVTTSSHSTACANGDLIFIKSRAGHTSIDDIVSEDGERAGGATMTSCGPKVYNQTSTRTAAAWNAGGYVGYNVGVSRPLTLNLLDTCIQKCREAGGEPKLIMTGWDQYFNLERLLSAHQRYMGQEEFQVGVGDERTLPGTKTGLVLSTYMGIPILPDVDCPKSIATDGTVLGSNLYVLDTDYLEFRIAVQPTYIENKDYFAASALVVRGLFYQLAELICTRPDVQCKVADLAAS